MPLTRRQIYNRRRVVVFGSILLVIITALYVPFTLLAPPAFAHEDIVTSPIPAGAKTSISWPTFGGSAFGAVGYDDLLETGGSADPMPIASISKIVTALVTLDAKPLGLGDEGPTITFTQADHDLYGKYLALQGTVKAMPVGASMSEHEVLQVALIASANNYAATLADWAFGSDAAYETAATAWLTAHGLEHTSLVEPTGIDPANTSTASDLVMLGKLALANPVVAQIVDTPTLTLPIVGTIDETNKLLGQDGIIGIKTGTLTTSSLLFASRYTVAGMTVTIVGAVLGGTRDTIYPAVTATLTSIEKGFRPLTLATKGRLFAEYTSPWGQRSEAIATRTVKTVVWADTPVSTAVTRVGVRLGAKGGAAGAVTFRVGTRSIRVPLALDHALTDPGPVWRLTHPLPSLGL